MRRLHGGHGAILRPGDLDQLLLADAEVLDLGVRVVLESDAREQLDSSYTELRQLGHGYKAPGAQPSAPGTVGNPKPAPTGEQAADFLKNPPAKPKTPGEPLDESTAKQYMARAGGDKAKARELAKADGWGLGQ